MAISGNLLPFLCRHLPPELAPLVDLALDVRWTWNYGSDQLWQSVDRQAWEKRRNPWWILQTLSQKRISELAADAEFKQMLKRCVAARDEYLGQPTWFSEYQAMPRIAYFSMEFGLAEEIPLYAGGLGILAGDYLKTASDLGLPVVAVGLLYQEGYFRQVLGPDGGQMAVNPHNDPTNLPICPATDAAGGWLRVPLMLPGRRLYLRVWHVQVGRVSLYLLDSNEPTNAPADRGLIGRLYDESPAIRLVQEMALGIGGWKVLKALGIKCEVCHLNEGHAALVTLERARSFMEESRVAFPVALWATRAGNTFTTHTAVEAGFDVYAPDLVKEYLGEYAESLGMGADELVAMGRRNPKDPDEPFNMALVAARGSSALNGVSRLHRDVSKRLFSSWYPGWPVDEVPVSHVTNGVHMPSWDSRWADELWMTAGGHGCWSGQCDLLGIRIKELPDEEIWGQRNRARQELVDYVRRCLSSEFCRHSADAETLLHVHEMLDPDALTLAFARRFTRYKRPNLLLRDPPRLLRLLTSAKHPVQLLMAGKAHTRDLQGIRLIQDMVRFTRQPRVRHRAVFLPDYDMQVAQQLVQGADVWVNTPRRPWEACGTSGMKVLVNGGINLSELDGWWAEAYSPDVGWAISDNQEEDSPESDAVDASELYRLLEEEVIPEFYDRDPLGIPRRWINRIRTSMSQLAPNFSSNRMVRQYADELYLPASTRYQERTAHSATLARELCDWQTMIEQLWPEVRFEQVMTTVNPEVRDFEAQVYLGQLKSEFVRVEIYAEPAREEECICHPMRLKARLTDHSYLWVGSVRSRRPLEHFSMRVVPAHPHAGVPLEERHILWKYPICEKA
ncbi:MAG: alpha-glucan family phosphorylase [Chloroflexi bacterium]|nr:alpha-glucan family phosphorylase [Chloroflexota bacterium]